MREPGLRSRRGELSRRAEEFGVEHLGGHHLTAADQPDFVGAVIGDRPMQRAEVVPDQKIVLGPIIGVAELQLELMREQVFEHLVALTLRQFVDPLAKPGLQ